MEIIEKANIRIAPAKESAATIRPFHFHASQADLDDLRRRILATKFPEKETVTDTSQGVQLRTAVSVFPDDLYEPPRNWAEKAYPNLIYYNIVSKGGHFANWEQPKLFSDELRKSFRALRNT